MSLKYRSEIDGLRAFAVIPVILFHAGWSLFSGGYIGVDVFFVISGYLITSIIMIDIQNKRFSILDFYERRARRILPALTFIIFITAPFCFRYMLPVELNGYFESLISVVFFGSNIYFWRESGYFDVGVEEKPLLHTWSLAVEEQYYLFFPLLLLYLWRFNKKKVFWLIFIMGCLSLILSEVLLFLGKQTANFYLAPSRVWELFTGSLAAFLYQEKKNTPCNIKSFLGLVLILIPMIIFDEHTPTPSRYTLIPVLGALLVILYAGENTFVKRFLSFKVFVWIGLISYSAYLWHQPIFAFVRLKSITKPELSEMLIYGLLSILLAFITWKYIENPFRNRGKVKNSHVWIFSSLSLGVMVLFGVFGISHGGFPERFSFRFPDNPIESLDCIKKPSKAFIDNCLGEKVKEKTIYILGDSHAAQTYLALKNTTGAKFNGSVQVRFFDPFSTDYFPYSAFYNDNFSYDKDPILNKLLKVIKKGDVFIFTSFSGKYNTIETTGQKKALSQDSRARTEIGLRFINNITPLFRLLVDRGVNVYLQLDNPLIPSSRFLQCYQERANSNKASSCSVSFEQHKFNLKRQRWVYNSLKKVFSPIQILNIDSIFFPNKAFYDPVENWGFVDKHHISQKYIEKLAIYYTGALDFISASHFRSEH
tara:strand:- start:1393 stop:3342 length:1950 start_codon:yes stop_codon:yes gene_type:complete